MTYPAQEFSRTPPARLTPEQLARRMAEAFPEAQGPAQEHESGRLLRGGEITAHSRPGAIPRPSGMTAERIWAERAEAEQRWAATSPAERAAAEQMRAMVREEIRRA